MKTAKLKELQQWRILTFVLLVLENALKHLSILDLFIFPIGHSSEGDKFRNRRKRARNASERTN